MKPSSSWIYLLLAVGTALPMAGGCAQLKEPSAPPSHPVPIIVEKEPVVARQPLADDVLVYLAIVLGMPPEQQAKEFKQVKNDFVRSGQPENRMRLVGLSLLPGRSNADRAQAGKLLDDYLAERKSRDGGLEGLAALLKSLLNDQKGLEKQLNGEKDRADGLARQLKEQTAQLDELKKQLNDLKNIEKIISDREKAGLPEKR